MDANVYQSTEYCRRKILEHKAKDMPFDKLVPGLSFFVPTDILSERSLRAVVSSAGAKNDKVYRCIKHKEHNFFEITIAEEKEAEALTFQITESSPKAKQINTIVEKRNYPFDQLSEGVSFTIPIAQGNESSLRASCSTQSKKLGKKFVCIKHKDRDIYEIACIAKVKPLSVSGPALLYESSPEAQRMV